MDLDVGNIEQAVSTYIPRLRTLKFGLLILAGLSALAIVPASHLPNYRLAEIPDPPRTTTLDSTAAHR
ncbi:hypothetical protein [Nocardia sp. NPDC058480]|uniref:hypothetical protein n=1 Tax=unclassified Nocardia TaxID=2637762 RepID=UPI003647E385